MTVTTPRLSEVARHLIIPEGIETSVFPRVQRRLADVGVSFDRWQQGFGQVCLGCRSTGKYAATVGGVVASWPRQIGKTYTVGNIAIGLCLEFPGYRAIWTSHHNRTTTNTFRTMQAMVRNKNIWPHVEAIRTANGEQEIVFKNGSIIMFGAREQGFGRGMDKIDLIVFDEAQILGLKALEDMVPATNASRHPHGGLVIFIGTPPRPSDDGEAFTAKRAKALAGKTADQVYCEISAGPDVDPEDQEQFGSFNPSYPHRTSLEAMLRMIENIPDQEARRREMLGIWPPAMSRDLAIDADVWFANEVAPPDETSGRIAFGAYTNLPRTNSAIGAATDMGDGTILVEIVPAAEGVEYTNLPGTSWLPPRMHELEERWSPVALVVDGYSAAASLLPAMEELGLDLTVTQARDMARACGMVFDALMEGRLKHLGQDGLTKAALSAKWRELSDSRAWDRKDKTSDITELVAMTLAVYGLITCGPEPKEVEVWGFFD